MSWLLYRVFSVCVCVCACIQGALGSSNEILRCAAGEALGRIVQVVGESKFIADMAQYSFDRFIRLSLTHPVCDYLYMLQISK